MRILIVLVATACAFFGPAASAGADPVTDLLNHVFGPDPAPPAPPTLFWQSWSTGSSTQTSSNTSTNTFTGTCTTTASGSVTTTCTGTTTKTSTTTTTTTSTGTAQR